MPVNDLATYLGMPAQAPAQPLFSQAANPYSADAIMANAAARQQLMGMQRAAPIIQAQQAQLAYDEVAQKARDLRMKQEIEAQAERAVNELAGINPQGDDFGVRAREVATRNPLALASPRAQQILNLYSGQNTAYQQQHASQAEAQNKMLTDLEKARIDAIEAGVPREKAFEAQTPYDIAALRGSLPKGSGTGMEPEERRLKMIADIAERKYKAISDSPNATDEQIAQAEAGYMSALDAWGRFGEPKTVATTTTQAAVPPAATTDVVPTSFMDTMKKGAGQAPNVEDILKVTDEEVIKDINSPDATDDTFMAAISDPNASEKVKTTALERLRQFAKAPKFPLGTTSREARNRISNLQEKIKEGEKLIRMGPEMEKYHKAWTAEKNDIASDIEAYAKSLGLDADLVAADLAKNEPLTDDPENPFTIRDDFNKFLKGKLDKKSMKISPFEGSEFASEFGMEGVIPGFRSIGKGRTYSDVLDAYLGEKFGQNQPATSNPVAPAIKPSNIKSITPIE